MNPEIVRDITVAGSVIGLGVGMAAEQFAIRRSAKNVTALSETWGLEDQEADSTVPEQSRLRAAAQSIGRAVGPLALTACVAGGLNAYAYAPENNSVQQAAPTLEVVVDHSGATALALEGTPVVNEINQVVKQFKGIARFKTEAIVAGSGTTTTMKLEKVADVQPFGQSDLASATSLALSRAAQVTPSREGAGYKPNAGVLIITNGNGVGNAKSIAALASQEYAGKTVKTPVSVVNVEGGKASPAVTESLKTVAAKTGGKYWSAEQGNLDQVAKAVRAKIESGAIETGGSPDKLPLKVLGGLVVAAAVETFRRRETMPFQSQLAVKKEV